MITYANIQLSSFQRDTEGFFLCSVEAWIQLFSEDLLSELNPARVYITLFICVVIVLDFSFSSLSPSWTRVCPAGELNMNLSVAWNSSKKFRWNMMLFIPG